MYKALDGQYSRLRFLIEGICKGFYRGFYKGSIGVVLPVRVRL